MGRKPNMTAKEAREKYLAENNQNTTSAMSARKKPTMTAKEAREKYLAENGRAHEIVSDADRANAWIDRYKSAVTGVSEYDASRNGRYTADVSGGYGTEIDDLIGEYERNRSLFDGFEMQDAFAQLQELRSEIQKGNEYMKTFGTAKSYYDAQVQARELQAQQKEVEAHRASTRDGATIQKELDEVNAQIQEAYKPVKTQEIFDTLGAIASNVLVSSSGLSPVSPQGAQITPEIVALERRKRELEEEQGWAQYFAEEKYMLDSMGWEGKYAGQTYDVLMGEAARAELDGDSQRAQWLRGYAGSNMTDQDRQAVIERNETEIAILEAVLAEYATVAEQSKGGVQNAVAREKQLMQQYGSQVDLQRRIDSLKNENWQLGNEIAYGSLSQNQDFAQKSGYSATKDLIYEYINKNPLVEKDFAQKSGVNSALSKYDEMTKEEVAAYNYLYATQGKKQAEEYLDYLSYTLNARKMEKYKEKTAERSTGFLKGLARSFDSVPLTLVSGVGLIDAGLQYIGNDLKESITGEYAGPVDYNRDAMKPSVAASTIRGTVSKNIANATGTINMDPNKYPTLSKLLNGKSLGDVYQLGMSMADSLAVAALSPLIGAAGTALLGGSAGTQGMLDAVANGATDGQAISMGVLSGAFEMIFEKVSLDKLLDGGSKNVIHAVLTQGAVEGSEEAFTSIANTVADIVVMAEKSGWEKNIAAYIDQGMTPEEAKKEAFLDVAIQIGWDFVGGMASGGIMGGVDYQIRSKGSNSQTPVNPVAEQTQRPAEEIDPDSVQGQIIRNWSGEQQTQQPVFDPERDSVQAQILRHWNGEEQTQNIGTREQQEQVARLSRITGREVVLYQGESYENGYFDRSDGKIYVNVNGVDPVVQTFSHELTHSTEGAKVYNGLKSWVFDKFAQSGKNLAQMKAEKIRLYESRGKQLDSVGAEQEIVAEYISQNLLTNEQAITEVCRSKPTVGRQILNWIDRFLSKLGVTSKDRAALEHAKILYAKALNQTQSSFGTQTSHAKPVARGSNRQATADDTAAWTEMLAFRDRIQSELTAGNITEEEYNQYSDMADQWEQELLGRSGTDVQHSIADVDEAAKEQYDSAIVNLDILRLADRVESGNFVANEKVDLGVVSEENARVIQEITGVDVRGFNVVLEARQIDHIFKDHGKYGSTDHTMSDVNDVAKMEHTLDSPDAIRPAGTTNAYVSNTDGKNRPAKTVLYEKKIGEKSYYVVEAVPETKKRTLYIVTAFIGKSGYKAGALQSTNANRPGATPEAESASTPTTMLNDNGRIVKQYSISDASSKQDVVRGLKDILRRGGDLNELRQFVAQVEQDTASEKQNAPRADQNTREAERILRSAKQQGISVEEYLSQNWELYETETGWDPAARKALELEKADSRQYSFAGRNALTADDSLLASAKQMRLEGVDDETIRQETGWLVGKDGMWRFEIDDSQMELSDTIHNYMRLGDLIQHEKLFAAYPDLAYIQVTFENLPNGVYGQYNRQFDSIAVSNKLTDPDVSDAFKNALVHEIQHAIQNREGFTAGATVEGWNRKIERGFDSRRSKDIRKAKETEQKLAQIRKEQPEFYQSMMELEAMTPTVPRGEIDWDTLEQIEEDPPEWQAFDARRDALQEQYGDMEVWDFMDLLHDRKRLAQTGRTAVELYHDTAGEIEARNVESRRSYTQEQRKNSPPRLGGEDTVLAEGDNISSDYISGMVSDGEIEANINTIAEMESVITIRGDEFRMSDGKLLVDVTRFFESIGGYVYNDRLGDIYLRKRGVKNDLGHGMSDEKAASFAAIPAVLQYGKVAGYVVNYEGRGYDSATVVAPITIGQEPYMMGVIVHRSNGENRFYVHDVIAIKEEVVPLITGTQKMGVAGGTTSTISIIKKILDVKRKSNSKQFSVSDTQTEAEDQSIDASTARERLPRKAQEYLKRAERKLLRDLAGVMNAHRFADRSYLQEVVQQISEEYLIFGSVSQDTMNDLFAQAYNRGIVVDTEFYNQFKEVKDYLRTVSVTLAQRDTQNIADWFDFRRRTFGTLRIVNEGGLPVDTAYGELHTMAPGLFPESIAHPADQLVHMYEVGKSITKSEKSLSDYHRADAQTYRKWAKNDFEAAVGNIMKELQTVKRFADEKAAREAEEAEKVPVTQEEVMSAYAELKQARKTYQKAMTKNLLSESDEMKVGRLLKGEILPEHLDESKDNVKGILAVYEAKKDYERLCGIIGEYKRHRKGELRQLADSYLKNAGEWVDKKIGLLYSRETMRRNIQDIVKDQKEAAAINAEFFDPIQVAEAVATRFKTEYRDRVRELNLSTKARRGDLVSEAHAVQLLGEVMDNIKVLEDARGMLRQKDGKTLAEWRALIDEMWQSSPSLDREKIEGAVREFRYIYDKLFQQMNEVRVRNGYEPVSYRRGYFPHFQPGGDGIIAQFGKALGISTEVNALPTTINGLTHTFKPGIQWFGNAQERLGFNTAYDAVEGFDKYIEGVASVIHQTDNIQKLRALAAQVRYRTTNEGIRQQVDEVQADTRLTEEEKQSKINDIYEHGKFSLSHFVVELDEYTNLLANKKSRLDRTVEGLLGRKVYTVMKNVESRVGANMIAGNLSSALTNFIPLTQASAQLDRFSLLRGMWSALQSYRQDDGIVGKSTFLTNRRGSDPLVRTWAEKVSGVLSTPMELIDTFVSDSIVRAAYFQNLRRGLSEAEAMHQADIFAAGVIADRSKGSMPTLFASTNPVFKAFTQFQLEVNNQFSEVFKDLPHNHAEKGAAMLALVLLKYFLGAWLFDETYEYFIGRRPALDPIDLLNSTVGDLTGYELPNILELGEGIISGEMPSFETEKVGFGKAMTNFATGALEELPFSAGLGMFGVELDGGRIPVSSAIPDFSALWDAATDTEKSGKKRWKEAQTELNKLAYIVPPFGGNQISKIWKGIKAYVEGGSYNVDNEGNDVLQYPVYKDDPQDAFWSLVRATIMGKSSLPEAQAWVDSGFDSFTAKQTAIYQDLLDAGVADREAYGVLCEFEAVTKTPTESKETRQRQFLRETKLSDEGKAIIYYGMLASEKDQLLMDKLTDLGAAPRDVAFTLMDIQDADDASGIRDVIAGAALTDQEKVELYRAKVSDSQDADIAALATVGVGFDEYLEISGKRNSLKNDKSVENKGLEFSYWVDSQGFSEKQSDVIKACFGDDDFYEEYVDKGLDPDMAYELADEIDDLEPMEGKRSVADVQRWRICVDFTDNVEDQMTALYAVMKPTQYQKIEIAHEFGVTPRAYVFLEEVLPMYDADGNGSFKQAEITAAIDSLEYSNDVKAVLWQMTVGKNTKWKNNPYSQKIGQQVYEARQSAPKVTDQEESTFADDFSAAIAKQWE